MRKKNAFTLVELLGVLVLLAVIGLITVPTVNKLINNSKSKARTAQITLIEKAAKSWASENTDLISEASTYYLEVQTLIDTNYLAEDSIVDPEDSTKNLNQCVRIYYDNNYNSYEYTYSNCAQNVNTDCFTFDSVNQVITAYNFDDVESCPMDVVIPETIEGTEVLYINPGAFNGLNHKNKITSVDFSQATYLRRIYNSETDETEGAFANNLITYVDFGNLPEFYYIGDYAFYNNDLESIDFIKAPALTTINKHSFEGNQLLTVNLSNLPLLAEIDTSAFAYNNIYGEIKIENSPLLNLIGEHSFEYNSITKLVLNNLPELLQVESDSFYGNLIKNLSLNNLPKLAGIRSRSFEDNYISNITMSALPSLIYIGSSTFSGNPLKNFDFSKTPNLVTINDDAFSGCDLSGVLDISMLTKLEYLGEYAFEYNYYTSINWGSINKLTTIGPGAFLYNSLSGAGAFIYARNPDGTVDNTTLVSYGGSRVKRDNIVLPATIKKLGLKSFRYCDIRSFVDGSFDPLTSIENGAFTGNLLPDSQAFIYKKNSDASYDYTTLVSYGGATKENVKLPSTIVTIGYQAFRYCEIENIDLTTATNLTTIEDEAFINDYITSITIPDTVTSIGDYAFYRDSSNEWNDITILGNAMRFNSKWTTIGFAPNLMPTSAYKVYATGTATYFNPVTGKKCTAGEAVSTTGTKAGCMKWYIINDGGSDASSIDLILDHNTTAAVAWNPTGSNVSGPTNILTQLQSDTSSWAGIPTRSDSYSVSNGTATYTINYSTYKARLISAAEIAAITGNSSFAEATATSSNWFYLDSNTQTQTATTTGASNYDWLFDYTNGCTSYGCNIADASNNGYWTSTAVSAETYYACIVFRSGMFYNDNVGIAGLYGVRPVITILKSKI